MERYNIAIIGMGGVFPGANNVQEYWRNIMNGETFITEMPEKYWKKELYFDEDTSNKEKTYTTKGAFINDFEFPYLEYKIPPNVMKSVDPAQHVALEATREALKDAGIEQDSEDLHNAATIIGASGVDGFAHATIYLRRNHFFERVRKQLREKGVSEEHLSRLSEEFRKEIEKDHGITMSSAAVGLTPSAISNRVAQIFGIHGFNMTVDSACASSFSALDVACHALMAGDVRLVVTGGVDLGVNPSIYIGFSNVEGLSFSGVSNPFDRHADGLVIGEGGGMVILKRLEDALEDGDNIRAVIRGVGSSSDGAGQAIYAPNSDGRARAFRQALRISKTSASDVQYIEAHATSTVVGDANEYDAIVKAYDKDRDNPEPICLGSVKYQIGHLKAGAGMAGLIKTVLAMENGAMPHMPLYEKLTPHAERESNKFVIPTEMRDWKPDAEGKRVAAVTSSGFGGANYHAVLEQGGTYTPTERTIPDKELAVVGVSVRVAGADNPDGFWQNLTAGRDVFTRPDPEDIGWQHHVDFGPENERITTKALSMLQDFRFNNLRFKIFPNSVSQIATSQILGIDLADKLLQQKGFDLKEPKNIGVSIGAIHDDYFPFIFDPMVSDTYIYNLKKCASAKDIAVDVLDDVCAVVKEQIREANPSVTEHTLPGWMGNIIAGRIANKLNLQGPNIVVDSACSSGVSAMLPAIYQLMFGEEDMMLSGGLNRQITDVFTSGVCGINALTENNARPFDKDGTGYLIGEGGVLYLLKRLKAAERDGDEILAVVDSIDGSSEAEGNSMIAPSEVAARRAIARTMRKSSVDPKRIGVVDAHGSANKLSDIVEVRSLAAEIADGNGPVNVSAVKSHIGHIYGGSGAASMFSVIRSMTDGKVPGIRNLRTIRPEIADLTNKVRPVSETVPATEGKDAGGVLSLGLGGANYFAVLRKYGAKADKPVVDVHSPADQVTDNDSDGNILGGVFLSIAQDDNDLKAAVEGVIDAEEIPDFLPTGGVGVRYAATYEDRNDLIRKLRTTISFLDKGHDVAPLQSQGIFFSREKEKQEKLAFCFPGQGTHYVGMARFLYRDNALFREVVDRVHALAARDLDFDLVGHIYGDASDPAVKRELGTIIGAQMSLFAVEVGVARVLESLSVKPAVLIGHSFGEISALTFAGVWDIETGFNVVKARIRAAEYARDQHSVELGMMSIICTDRKRDAILKLAGDRVVLTNINAPGRFIFAGERAAVENAVDLAENFGLEAQLLPIGSAFHSHFMKPAQSKYETELRSLACERPRYPILSTITGDFIDADMCTPDRLAKHLSVQLVTSINFPREITRLFDEGVRHFLEVGPKWSLTKMISRILKDHYFRATPSLHPKIGDEEVFRRARAFLAATGHLTADGELDNMSNFISDDMLSYLKSEEPKMFRMLEQTHPRFLSWYEERRNQTADTMGTATSAPVAAEVPAKKGKSTTAVSSVAASDLEQQVKVKLVEMTGYPEDMLESELDLEADLGIDSIQRAELWVGLAEELGIDKEARPSGKIQTIADFSRALAELSEGEAAPTPEETPHETPAPTEEKTAAPAASAPSDLEQQVKVKLVEMTGYPEDMLESDLNLEADLGIDSIQRAELWVALAGELGIDKEARPERSINTIAELALALGDLKGNSSGATAPSSEAGKKKETSADIPGNGDLKKKAWGLFTRNWKFVDPDTVVAVPCSSVYAIVDEPGKYSSLRRMLAKENISVSFRKAETFLKKSPEKIREHLSGNDTVLYMVHGAVVDQKRSSLTAEEITTQTETLFSVFKKLHSVLLDAPKRVIVPALSDQSVDASSDISLFAAFPAGFVKSLQRELPESRFQVLYGPADQWNDIIVRYASRAFDDCEISFVNGAPVTPAVSEVTFPDTLRFPVGADDLVLVTGGARGIVFECVRELAERTGCSLLLTGRTQKPSDDVANRDLGSVQELRKLEITLKKEEGISLKAARKKAAVMKKQWEIAANLRRLDRAGIAAEYYVCDVSDELSLKDLISEMTDSGRKIRGVVHGAGVQRSRQLVDLPVDDALLTVCTKLIPLNTLVQSLNWEDLRMFIGFGSIAGLFGNAGQTDYSLANDMLADTISRIGKARPGLHARTIEWTAWKGTGMVKDEEAKRFEEGGLIPVDVENGVALFLAAAAGVSHSRIAVFNTGAELAGTYEVLDNPVPARPRQRLVDDTAGDGRDIVPFSLERDGFLMQHLVNGKPVVPGTFITEMCVESSAVTSDRTVADITFRRPLEIRDGSLDVELLVLDDTLLILPAERRDLPEKALRNLCYSSCSLVPSADQKDSTTDLSFNEDDVAALESTATSDGVPFYSRLDNMFSHALKTGPVFRGICAVGEQNEKLMGIVSLTHDASTAFSAPGSFVIHPVLADMAVQVASSWSMTEHDVMAIPYEIGSLTVHARSEARDYVVVCRSHGMDRETSTFDVAVYDRAGTLLFTMNRLVLRSIAGN